MEPEISVITTVLAVNETDGSWTNINKAKNKIAAIKIKKSEIMPMPALQGPPPVLPSK